VTLTRITFPYLLFITLVTLLSGILNDHRHQRQGERQQRHLHQQHQGEDPVGEGARGPGPFPYLLFITLVTLLSGILNARRRFAAAAAAPVLLNVSRDAPGGGGAGIREQEGEGERGQQRDVEQHRGRRGGGEAPSGVPLMPVIVRALAPGFADEPEKFALAVTLTRITFPKARAAPASASSAA
jgi:hypothetical protein